MADASTSRDANATIKRALDRIAAIHATPENYFADARRDLDEARQFVRSKDLLTLPARDNLQVIETPEFMRGIYAGRRLQSRACAGAAAWSLLLDHTHSIHVAERTNRIEASRVQLLTG